MIGYLGPEGTFTQRGLEFYRSSHVGDQEAKSYSSIPLLFQALKSGEIVSLFIPVENSYGGDVFAAFEGLLHMGDAYSITGELFLSIEQSLMVKPGATLADITTVFSHERSARQCSVFLQEQLAGVETVCCSSNAVAAERVSESEMNHVACLGHRSLAEKQGLVVLNDNVHSSSDLGENVTRFINVSEAKTVSTGNDKTSFVFSSAKDRPGSLCEILTYLSEASINMTRISSRPAKTLLGEYVFFIDCEGHCLDAGLAACLERIKEHSSYYAFLGSYAIGQQHA